MSHISPHQARPSSTPKRVSHKGPMKVQPTTATHITPKSKCGYKTYNPQCGRS